MRGGEATRRHQGPSFVEKLRSTVSALSANFLWDPSSFCSVPRALEQWAREHPTDIFLLFEGKTWTIGELNGQVNRHARAYQELGLGRGDVVALVMDNRPSYLFHLYGLLKIGVIPSLINPALEGAVLSRAIESSGPRAVVAGEKQAPALVKLKALGEVPPLFLDPEFGDVESGFIDFRELVAAQPEGDIPGEVEETPLDDVAAYIFTSGTTGFPKPAVVKHHRLLRAGRIFGGFAQLTPRDCLYCCLPLYHGNATIIATPMAIMNRCRLALSRRFSSRRFWEECRAVDATIFIYIGELCRYLDAAPLKDGERDHTIDRMIGNGLRPDLWDRFKERFGLRKVIEFYAATEGNAETLNLLGIRGSCGLLLLWKMALIRYDTESDEPIRGSNGLCQRTGPGEVGLLVGKIAGKNEFPGYANREASRRKVLVDVFKRGDQWFHSGDLLRHDWFLHLHFVDRLGDTFRWKGENVSTQEVAAVLSAGPGVIESTVYGVRVPSQEGRAGMAALVVDDAFDVRSFYRYVSSSLPSYAQPRFLRIVEAMELTGTFRHRKMTLREQGYSAAVVDPLLLRDIGEQTYLRLDDDRRQAVLDGSWPL